MHPPARRIIHQGAFTNHEMDAQRTFLQSNSEMIGAMTHEQAYGDDERGKALRRAGLHSFAGRIYFKGETDLVIIKASETIVVSLDAGQDSHAEWADARARHRCIFRVDV